MRIIVIMLPLFIILLFGCDKKTETKKKTNKQSLKTYFLQKDKEKFSLLSIKYKIDEVTTEKIIDEYLSKHDILFKALAEDRDKNSGQKQLEIDRNFQATLNDLSIKYSISKEIIANLIIDYKVWSGCEVRSQE